MATDNLLATATSASVWITVAAAPPPRATLTLTTQAHRNKGNQVAVLAWTPGGPGTVTISRDGVVIATGPNDGAHTDLLNRKGGGSYVYKVCTVASPAVCSNESRVVF